MNQSSANASFLVNTSVASAVNALAGLVTGVAIARLLGPEDRGYLAAIVFLPGLLAPLGMLSIPEALTYHVSKNRNKSKKLLKASLLSSICFSILSISIVLISIRYFKDQDRSTGHIEIVFALMFVPLNSIMSIITSYYKGMMDSKMMNAMRIIPPLAYLLSIAFIIIITGNMTVEKVIFSQVFGLLIGALLSFNIEFMKSDEHCELSDVYKLISTGAKFHVGQSLTLFRRNCDRFLVISLLTPSSVGIFVVGLMISRVPMALFVESMTSLLFPRVSSANELHTKTDLMAESFRISCVIAALIIPITFIVGVLTVKTIFGNAYIEIISILPLFSLASGLDSVRNLIVVSLQGVSDWKIRFFSEGSQIIFLSTTAYMSRVETITEFLMIWIAVSFATLLMTVFAYSWIYNTSIYIWWPFTVKTLSRAGNFVKLLFNSSAKLWRTK